MKKKALLVGINEYPDPKWALTACLNDVNDLAELLVDKCHFPYDNVRLLTERRATRVEILKRLEWLLDGLKAGDQLVFFYSGHGNRLAMRNVQGHVDSYYECICPYDFCWEGKNNISDKELCELFSRIPKGVKLVWISDSCYSGGLSEPEQGLDQPGPRRGKTIVPPADIHWRVQTAIAKKIAPGRMSDIVNDTNVLLISATKEFQQAQEKLFKQEIKVNGLLTYYLLEELKRKDGLRTPMKELMERVVKSVKLYAETSTPTFRQEPTLHGRPELIKRAFLR